MGAASMLVLLLTHPNDFRTLTQYWLYHEAKRDITATQEHPSSGWDRPSMRRCWEFLDMTSRSFSAVIKEVEGDLARTICLFYLTLRGLDTIEDDMTIRDETKQPLLRAFHTHLVTPGWTFNGCGPRERDRQLLVEFDVVIEEISRLSPASRDVIVDICSKMEAGMADYAHKAVVEGRLGLDAVSDLDLYCHYVAGLVGEGLSRLFAVSGKEASWLGDQLTLSNSMGLLLQKTNILRDFREDVDQGRLFWPREIWGAYGFSDPTDMYAPQHTERALWALSAMTLDALRHATEALDYLTLLRNQSVFNFCAIPQTMALATLALCFMNPLVLQQNVKIRKAEAARLIMRSTNPRDVAYMFRDYARVIHSKATPADPNFLPISIACGKIEQWCEHHYPSFIQLTSSPGGGTSQTMDTSDARSRIVVHEEKRAQARAVAKRAAELQTNGPPAAAPQPLAEGGMLELYLIVGAAFVLVIGVTLLVVWLMMMYFTD